MNTLSSENKEKIEKAIKLLDSITTRGIDFMKNFPEDKYELFDFTLINYLERFIYSIESITILLKNIKEKPNVETAIGLTIRAGLLDFMTISYLSTYIQDMITKKDKESEDKFDKIFNGLMTDQIAHTLKYLKLARDTGLIKQHEYKSAIEGTCEKFSFLFTDNEIDYINPVSKLISGEMIRPIDMFTRMKSHPLTEKFAKVYDYYLYYSKYEHFGIMTHFMQRQGLDKDFSNIVSSIKYLTRGISACLAFLTLATEREIENKMTILDLQNEFDQL